MYSKIKSKVVCFVCLFEKKETHCCFLFEFENIMESLLQHMYLGLHDPLERVKRGKKNFGGFG
jgi:hypothetical protein